MNPPTSVKVIGTIGLLWGGLAALVMMAFTVAFVASPVDLLNRLAAWTGKPLPAGFYEAVADPVLRALSVILALLQMGLYGALCWGSWRLLRLQEAGRKWVLGCALAMVLLEAGEPQLDRFVWQPIRQKYDLPQPEPRKGFRISLGMLYAGAAWYFLTRPSVKEQFLT